MSTMDGILRAAKRLGLAVDRVEWEPGAAGGWFVWLADGFVVTGLNGHHAVRGLEIEARYRGILATGGDTEAGR